MRWFFDLNRYNDDESDIIGLTYKVNGITETREKIGERGHNRMKQTKMRFITQKRVSARVCARDCFRNENEGEV